MVSKAIVFIAGLLITPRFWLLFMASFTCVMMMAWRGSLRDDIFKLAQKTVGKKLW